MEEPQKVHIDENRVLSEKKQKRIVKTREQVAALESFYNEHKYPTEAMKMELAESIGLTDKQVSGWFCHRRLKDKKSPNDEARALGKQDRSSGVIQDRGSGLRQDSCGSTKQADNKHPDPKEVESRRYTAKGILPTKLRYDHGSQHNSIMEDETSSGSSSPLKNSFYTQKMDYLGTATSKYPTHNDLKSIKGRAGPSGYLKVKGQAENAAITAVKRQLGRHYREDGPPLGIEFEPLPPGAFENQVKIPVNQSYYVGDRTALQSLDGSKTFQPPNASKMYERSNLKSCHAVNFNESGLEIIHASKHPKSYHADSPYKQTPLLSKHRHSLSARSLQTDVNDDSAGETSVHEIREHVEMRTKYGPGVRKLDSLANHHLIAYGKNVDDKQVENYPRNYTPKVIYRERIEPTTSVSVAVKRGKFVELEDQGMPRKTFKDDKFDEERIRIDEFSKLVSAKTYPGNEMPPKVTKRSRDEFTHQGYSRKETLIDVPPRNTMTNRSSVQMSASFSDDETSETTSGE